MTAGALALAAVSTVSALSFVQVFAETSSVLPAVLAGLFAHLGLRAATEARVPPLVAGVGLVTGFGLLMAWSVAPHTTTYGIPTADTLQVLGERLGDGFGAIRTEDTPIGPHNGIVLVAAVGIFLAALAADWVAFRAGAVLSACLPAATLFTLTAALGEERHQAALSVAFAVAALTFVLAHAPAQAGDTHAWFTGDTRRLGPPAVVRAGLPLVLVAALAAPLLGPRLPEARSAAILDLKPGSGDGPRTRVTVSPLVDVGARLDQSPPVEVFTVRAAQPVYWRMAALETYDGRIWSSLADYERADDELPADTTAIPTAPLVQDYRISNLAQFWLPAAYRPATVDLPGARVNPASLTLLTEEPTADGLAYRVESAVPTYTPADLTGETGRVTRDLVPFLALPEELEGTAVARGFAQEATAGRRTVYEKALALQNFFRQNFVYSEDAPRGHSSDRLVDFLVHSRAGFCEQFSAAFAVMARSLGIPARVAVGFTPGRLDPTGTYHVTSAEAHAWPEVYIDPYGWVAFEPTPGRFNPSPGNHTGTFNADAQQSPSDQLDPAATPTTVTPGDPPAVEETVPPATGDDRSPSGDGAGNPWFRRVLVALMVAVGGGVVGPLALMQYRRARRRRRLAALDPAGSILEAWDDVVEQLRLDGLSLASALTPAEAAGRAASHEPGVAPTMDELREVVDRAAYSPSEPDPDDAAAAWSAARQVVAVLERDDSARLRLRRRILTPRV